MKLMVHERFALLNMLPEKSTYAGMKSIMRARGALSFTPEDIELYKMSRDTETGRWDWDADAAEKHVLDIPVEEYIVQMIRQKLEKMDKDGNITQTHMSLYEKFILDYRNTV